MGCGGHGDGDGGDGDADVTGLMGLSRKPHRVPGMTHGTALMQLRFWKEDLSWNAECLL